MFDIKFLNMYCTI